MPAVECTNNNAANSGHFPLSWIFGLNSNRFTKISLLKKSTDWISHAEFESIESLKFELGKLLKEKSIVIRGCDKSTLKALLGRQKRQEILYGKEAVLSLTKNHFEKKSLNDLIRRGLRHGNVSKIEYSTDAINKLNILKSQTIHSEEPQLKDLFIDYFHPSISLFVFKSKNDQWLAAMTVSQNSMKKLHTELLLRHKNAPIGVMEALINKVFKYYSKLNFSELSLGEVPFTLSKIKGISFWNKVKIYTAGKIIRNAYNFEGLYNFKNKFEPVWNDIYLIGVPRVRHINLLMIAYKSNLLNLIKYKFVRRIKRKLGIE